MVSVELNELYAKRFDHPMLVDSLVRLTRLACTDSGGGRAAAKVVLSTYNSTDYPLDVVDLGVLDQDHFEDAINVLRLRIEHSREPHSFFVNGDRLLNEIAEQWGMRPQ